MRQLTANCLLFFLLVSFMVWVQAAWQKDEFNSFSRGPQTKRRVSNGVYSSSVQNGVPSSPAFKSHNYNVDNYIRPAKKIAGVGVAVALLYGAVQKFGLRKYFRINHTAVSDGNDSSLKEKKDQEEIWKAIINIHAAQKENKAAIEAMEQSCNELSGSSQRTNEKLIGILSRLDDLDRSMLETSESVSALLNSTESRELESKLRSIEDSMEKETAALKASLRQLREEVPALMSKHDEMVTNKLSKFKEDLKRLLSNTGNKRK